jgi:hypothetical protein
MSVTSAGCTEVEYATERYSESPPLDGTKTDNGDTVTATRKMLRGFAPHIQVELQPTKPLLPPDLFICRKFTARSTTTKCSSAGLLTAPSSFAMQIALPLAKKTPLHLRRFVPSPWLCPMPLFHRSIGGNCAQASALAPLGGVCGLPRLRSIRCIFSTLF